MSSIIPILVVVTGIGYYILNSNKTPTFTLVYSLTCGHCSELLPSFKSLTVPGVNIAWVQSKHSKIKTRYVPAFFYTDREGNIEEYTGARDNASIASYLRSKNIGDN